MLTVISVWLLIPIMLTTLVGLGGGALGGIVLLAKGLQWLTLKVKHLK